MSSLFQLLVKENDRVREKIPEELMTLMSPHMERVNEVISPGLTLLRWTSLNIDAFVRSVQSALEEFELLVDRALDIMTLQIGAVLQEIQCMPLCELPDTEPWTVQEFLSKTQVGYILTPHLCV